jgi:hypothetical protein
MEIARMDYRFTAILILMLTALAFCATPAYPRNEYLNDGSARCGEAVYNLLEAFSMCCYCCPCS